MEKSIRLTFCILGSVILSLFSLPVFKDVFLNVFYRYELYGVGELFINLCNIIALIGGLLMIYYSIKLILINSILKNKEF